MHDEFVFARFPKADVRPAVVLTAISWAGLLVVTYWLSGGAWWACGVVLAFLWLQVEYNARYYPREVRLGPAGIAFVHRGWLLPGRTRRFPQPGLRLEARRWGRIGVLAVASGKRRRVYSVAQFGHQATPIFEFFLPSGERADLDETNPERFLESFGQLIDRVLVVRAP